MAKLNEPRLAGGDVIVNQHHPDRFMIHRIVPFFSSVTTIRVPAPGCEARVTVSSQRERVAVDPHLIDGREPGGGETFCDVPADAAGVEDRERERCGTSLDRVIGVGEQEVAVEVDRRLHAAGEKAKRSPARWPRKARISRTSTSRPCVFTST